MEVEPIYVVSWTYADQGEKGGGVIRAHRSHDGAKMDVEMLKSMNPVGDRAYHVSTTYLYPAIEEPDIG